MKSKSYNYRLKLFIVLISPFVFSCEEIIEAPLPNNQLNNDMVFTDVYTANAALASLMYNVKENPLFKADQLPKQLGKYTDELESFTLQDNYYLNSISASDSGVSTYWRRTYSDLYVINAFLEGIEASKELADSDKEFLMGQGYFLRGLFYHYLCQLYGDIPLVISTDYLINKKIGKASYSKVLEHIESDLLKAYEFLDDTYYKSSRVYPNKAVVELMLAKNYLLQKRYDLVLVYSQSILDNPLYTLENDLNKVFLKDSKSTLWQFSPGESNPTIFQTPEAYLYIFTTLPPTGVALTNELLQVIESSDLRKLNWIKTVGNGSSAFSHAYKYKGQTSTTMEYSVVYRLEEAYFIKAEALAYLEMIPEAVSTINEIRSRRGVPLLLNSLSKQDFISELLEEYQREFFTEGGHRFFDLKRNNRLDDLDIIKSNWEAKHALFPIPESELLLNENLKPQNYGY